MKTSLRFFSGLWLCLTLAWSGGIRSVSAMGELPQQDTRDQSRPGVLVVGYHKTVSPRMLALPGSAALASQDQGLDKINAVEITVPVGQEESFRQELLQDPNVAYVERDYPVYAQVVPNDPRWPNQEIPMTNIHAPDAWDISTGSSSVTLAIVDSGIDAGHPEFAGRLVSGYDFVENDATPQDTCGHGTHVSGIAAATGNNHIGVAGVDWKVKIMPVRVLDGVCSGYDSGVARGILYAVDHGAKVINLSVGLGPGDFSQALNDALYYAYSHNVALIAAAGNNSYVGSEVPLVFPASSQWVLAVGAVNNSNIRASFSNISHNSNHRMIMAPGVSILSTTPRGSFYYQGSGVSSNYGLLSGTSMAAPFVSGAAALLAGLPGFDTPDKIYQALYKTALDLPLNAQDGWDERYGYGLLQIDLAMGFIDFSPPEQTFPVEYDYVTNTTCPNVAFDWIEVPKTDANFVPIWNDGGWAKLNLGFNFRFGGAVYSSIVVSDNGYLLLGDPPVESYSVDQNYPIPWTSLPNNYIAPLWADLTTSVGGQIYAERIGNSYVVEWWQVSHQGYQQGRSLLTFEVILYDSGQIVFQYETLRGVFKDGSLGTIGIEFADGMAGTQYAYNEKGALKERLAILFSPAEPGSTHTVAGCLFITRSELVGCNQLPPFGVDIFSDLIPANTTPTLRIENLQNVSAALPGSYLPLNHYARISLNPTPPTPFNPKPLVCYEYTPADVLKGGGHASNLFLANYNASTKSWEKLPTVVDQAAMRLVAPANHFSLFGVFALQPKKLPTTGSVLPPVAWWVLFGSFGVMGLLGWRRGKWK